MHYTKKTLRMDIDLDEVSKNILVQLKWKYEWKLKTGMTAWTYSEKNDFHNKSDKLVWKYWSNHFKLKVKGTSKFAKGHKSDTFNVNFDLKWVLKNEHWNVAVTKIPKGSFERSNVIWSSRKINLDTEDILKRRTLDQFPVAHEFGHANGNSAHAYKGGHGDEYKTASTHNSDTKSIMHSGSELRKRHLDFLIRELNTMITNTTFEVSSIK